MSALIRPNVNRHRRAAGLAALLLACGLSGTALADAHAPSSAKAAMLGVNGETIGEASLTATASGVVLVRITADGLTPGWHGVHIHETGACDASDGFKSAGGHLSGAAEHGVLVEGGPHPGDLANQMVGEDGRLEAEIFAPASLTLSGDGDATVLDTDGSAIVIHAAADDYTSQPSGDAGDRMACGVLEAVK